MYTVYTFIPMPLDVVLNRKVEDGKVIDHPVGKKIKTYKTYIAAYDRISLEQHKNTSDVVIYVREDSTGIVMNVFYGLN